MTITYTIRTYSVYILEQDGWQIFQRFHSLAAARVFAKWLANEHNANTRILVGDNQLEYFGPSNHAR